MSRAIRAFRRVALLDVMTLKMLLDDFNKLNGAEDNSS